MNLESTERVRELSATIVFLIFFAGTSALRAAVVGSNSAVSRQGATVFPAIDSNNEARGFVLFENGFSLEDGATTCTFNAFFPVYSDVALEGGSLYLSRPLILHSSARITSGGSIFGNDYTLLFTGTSRQQLPSNLGSNDELTFSDLRVQFNSDVTLNKTLTCHGACLIDGKGHEFELNSTASIVLASGASLLCRNVTLKGISDDKVKCLDSVATLSLCDVKWVQSGDFNFDEGHFDIVGDTLVTGTHIFACRTGQTSTIRSVVTLQFDSGMTFSYDPSAASGGLIAMTDSSSILHLYETTLHSTTTGLNLTKGTLMIEGECPVTSDATVEAEAIAFGDGVSAANDLTVKILPESGLRLDSGQLVYKNVS